MTTTSRLAPRAGTIFWGSVLLLLSTVTGIATALGTWDWVTLVWVVIAFGGLMVAAGLVGGIARAVTRPTATAPESTSTTAGSASTDRLTPDSTDAPLP